MNNISEVASRKMEKSILAIVLCIAGIILSIIYLCLNLGIYAGQIIVSNILKYLIALAFPVICFVLIRKSTSLKTIKITYIISFVLIGTQVLSAILYPILLINGVGAGITNIFSYASGHKLGLSIFNLISSGSNLCLIEFFAAICFFIKTSYVSYF